MVHERHALVDREIGVSLRDRRAPAPRHAHDDRALRRRDAAHELRIQLEQRRDRGIGQSRQYVEPGRIRHRNLVEDEWRQAQDVREAVAAGLLGDQRRGDQLRHIVARFTPEIAPVGDLEERLVIHGVRLARQPADLPLDAAGARVIRRGRQIDAAEALDEVLEMIDRGVGRLERIAPFVHPGVDLQAIAPTRGRHELPHPDRTGAAHRRIRQPAFDQREIDQILRQAARAQPLPDHALIAPQTGQPDLEAVARVELEELQVLEHPAIARKVRDVDVECRRRVSAEEVFRLLAHVLATHGHVGAGCGERVGGPRVEAVQGRLIGGGVLLDRRQRRPELYRRAVAGCRLGSGQRGHGSGRNMCAGAGASAAALNIENHTAVSRFIVSSDNSQVSGLSHSTLQVPRREADRLPSNTIQPVASSLPRAPTARRSPPSRRTRAPLSRPATRT